MLACDADAMPPEWRPAGGTTSCSIGSRRQRPGQRSASSCFVDLPLSACPERSTQRLISLRRLTLEADRPARALSPRPGDIGRIPTQVDDAAFRTAGSARVGDDISVGVFVDELAAEMPMLPRDAAGRPCSFDAVIGRWSTVTGSTHRVRQVRRVEPVHRVDRGRPGRGLAAHGSPRATRWSRGDPASGRDDERARQSLRLARQAGDARGVRRRAPLRVGRRALAVAPTSCNPNTSAACSCHYCGARYARTRGPGSKP